MFANFDAFQPDPFICLFGKELADVIKHIVCSRLATNCRHDPQIGETGGSEAFKDGQLGTILRHQQSVIKHLLQPRLDRFQSTEIEAPIVLVQFMSGKYESEGQSIAVN